MWKDVAIQETYARGNELQVPDCTHYFMENLQRLSDANYVPTNEDVLLARVRTTGVVEIQFSPVGENKKSGEVYRLFDVSGAIRHGQPNELETTLAFLTLVRL